GTSPRNGACPSVKPWDSSSPGYSDIAWTRRMGALIGGPSDAILTGTATSPTASRGRLLAAPCVSAGEAVMPECSFYLWPRGQCCSHFERTTRFLRPPLVNGSGFGSGCL